jgi:hypothetical protein
MMSSKFLVRRTCSLFEGSVFSLLGGLAKENVELGWDSN